MAESARLATQSILAARQTPAKAEPVFNQEDLLNRLMGDKVLASKLIAGFLNDVPEQLHTLKNGWTREMHAGPGCRHMPLRGRPPPWQPRP